MTENRKQAQDRLNKIAAQMTDAQLERLCDIGDTAILFELFKHPPTTQAQTTIKQ